MKILKYSLIAIIAILLMCSLSQRCSQQRKEKNFLDKYEHEDFSQFKGTYLLYRGIDTNGNYIVCIDAYLKSDFSEYRSGTILLDTSKYEMVYMHWLLRADDTNLIDTSRFENLAKKFINYKIPYMRVDTSGNAYIYLNPDELSFVKFVNENEVLIRSKEYTWKKIKNRDNWYK
jgi:hypothetical protein